MKFAVRWVPWKGNCHCFHLDASKITKDLEILRSFNKDQDRIPPFFFAQFAFDSIGGTHYDCTSIESIEKSSYEHLKWLHLTHYCSNERIFESKGTSVQRACTDRTSQFSEKKTRKKRSVKYLFFIPIHHHEKWLNRNLLGSILRYDHCMRTDIGFYVMVLWKSSESNIMLLCLVFI